MSDIQKFGEDFQRVGKDGFDAAVSSFGEVNKGLQAIAAECTAYSKKTFEDGTRAFEQLLSAKSFEQVLKSSLSMQGWLMKPMWPSCRSSVRCTLV